MGPDDIRASTAYALSGRLKVAEPPQEGETERDGLRSDAGRN